MAKYNCSCTILPWELKEIHSLEWEISLAAIKNWRCYRGSRLKIFISPNERSRENKLLISIRFDMALMISVWEGPLLPFSKMKPRNQLLGNCKQVFLSPTFILIRFSRDYQKSCKQSNFQFITKTNDIKKSSETRERTPPHPSSSQQNHLIMH